MFRFAVSAAVFCFVLLAPAPVPAQSAGDVSRALGTVLRELNRQDEPRYRRDPYYNRRDPYYRPEPEYRRQPRVEQRYRDPAPSRPAVSRATVREAQRLLNQLGYEAGPADGVMGRRTRGAVIAFQHESGLAPDGVIGPATMAALRSAEAHSRTAVYDPPREPRYDDHDDDGHDFAARGNGIDGLYCNGDDALAVMTVPGGVEFAVTSWQGGGHFCGLSGFARKSRGAWRHESVDTSGGCILTLTEEGGLALRTDDTARCADSCGARAQLNGLRFPARSRTGARVDPEMLEHVGSLEGPDPCEAARAEAAVVPAAAKPADGISGVYCTETGDLVVRETRGGIDFSVGTVYPPFSCGHHGTARRTARGWRHFSEEGGRACAINFVAGDGLVLNTEDGAGCTLWCGAGATIDGARFPASSRLPGYRSDSELLALLEGGRVPCP